MPSADPDPLQEVHRVLDRQEAANAWWVLPPLIFGGSAVAALIAELPELALSLGVAALLSGGTSGLIAWDRRRRLRGIRAILEQARREPSPPGSERGE